VAVILRPGKTPAGAEVALVLRHVVKAPRRRWPRVEILIRGDGHYARPEAMTWLEHHRVGYIFGLAGNKVLLAKVDDLAEASPCAGCRARTARPAASPRSATAPRAGRSSVRSSPGSKPPPRATTPVSSSGQAWSGPRTTNLAGTPRTLYEAVYCQRGQAGYLIKAHKLHLASDRTSCSKATANQFRLLIHTAAYWLLHTLRGLAPKTSLWRTAQFDTLRLALIKSLPAGSTRGSPPGSLSWSPGSRSPCRAPTPTRRASSGSSPAPPSARPEPRGSVPRSSSSPATTNLDRLRPGATLRHLNTEYRCW
jgi:hypothetical protein